MKGEIMNVKNIDYDVTIDDIRGALWHLGNWHLHLETPGGILATGICVWKRYALMHCSF